MNKSINQNPCDNEVSVVLKEEQKILEKMQQEKGSVSNALKLMGKRPGTVSAFLLYRNQILDNGPLSPKERTLIMLAAIVALRSANCIATQTKNAKNAGASENEIIQAMLIVGLISGNQPLNTAYASCFAIEGD